MAQDTFDFYCEEALSGKTPIRKLYESENVLAFYHTRPMYEEHMVIIPKKHIPDLLTLQDEDADIIKEIAIVARDIGKTLDTSRGIRLLTNIGKFQDTLHLHFALVQGEPLHNH